MLRQHAASLPGAMVADHERSSGPREFEWAALSCQEAPSKNTSLIDLLAAPAQMNQHANRVLAHRAA